MGIRINGTSAQITATMTELTAPPLTLACWFRMSSSPNFEPILDLSDAVQNANDNHYRLRFDSNGGNQRLMALSWSFTGYSGAFAANATPTNTWVHAAGVFTSTSLRKVYQNGTSDAATNTTSVTPTLGTNPLLQIGSGYWEGGALWEYVPGDIAEIGVWNVALSDAEVNMLAAGFPPILVRPQSLKLYVPGVKGYASAKGVRVSQANGVALDTDHPSIRRVQSSARLKASFLSAVEVTGGAATPRLLGLLGVGN